MNLHRHRRRRFAVAVSAALGAPTAALLLIAGDASADPTGHSVSMSLNCEASHPRIIVVFANDAQVAETFTITLTSAGGVISGPFTVDAGGSLGYPQKVKEDVEYHIVVTNDDGDVLSDQMILAECDPNSTLPPTTTTSPTTAPTTSTTLSDPSASAPTPSAPEDKPVRPSGSAVTPVPRSTESGGSGAPTEPAGLLPATR